MSAEATDRHALGRDADRRHHQDQGQSQGQGQHQGQGQGQGQHQGRDSDDGDISSAAKEAHAAPSSNRKMRASRLVVDAPTKK